MKTKSLGLIACVTLLGASPAAATTYSISNISDLFTGSITTDGKTGLLSSADILSWNLTIAANSQNQPNCASYGSCNFSYVLNPSDSQVVLQGNDLFATKTGALLFNYNDTTSGTGRFVFAGNNGGNGATIAFLSAGWLGLSTGYLQVSVNDPLIYAYGPESGNQAIAATPLPAALPLFATGLGGMGLLGWWRKRNKRTNAAPFAAT